MGWIFHNTIEIRCTLLKVAHIEENKTKQIYFIFCTNQSSGINLAILFQSCAIQSEVRPFVYLYIGNFFKTLTFYTHHFQIARSKSSRTSIDFRWSELEKKMAKVVEWLAILMKFPIYLEKSSSSACGLRDANQSKSWNSFSESDFGACSTWGFGVGLPSSLRWP